MKKTIFLTSIVTFSAASILLPSLHAEGFIEKVKTGIETGGAIAQKAVGGDPDGAATSGNAAMEATLKKLKADIAISMKAFEQTAKPDEKKIKEFDKALNDIDNVLVLTKDGGEYEQLIKKSYDENKKRLDKMKAKSNDTALDANTRATYEQNIPRFEKNINETNENRLVLIRMSNDLKKQRESIEKNKDVYLDMLSIDDLDAANKSCAAVKDSMTNLMSQLEKLGDLKLGTSEAPSKR